MSAEANLYVLRDPMTVGDLYYYTADHSDEMFDDVKGPVYDKRAVSVDTIHTHHNYAAWEQHYGVNVIVHRKGAVRAVDRVLIPGSMGTASYVGMGLENPLSFRSCSHGAGRVMSRTAAKKAYSQEAVEHEMESKGIHMRHGSIKDVAEECSGAYKDVDGVIEAQVDLVQPLARLRPLAVVKG